MKRAQKHRSDNTKRIAVGEEYSASEGMPPEVERKAGRLEIGEVAPYIRILE